MPILDSEKRPKGLRMPSFSAMKNNLRSHPSTKKNSMSEPPVPPVPVQEQSDPPKLDLPVKNTAPSSGSFSKIAHFPPPSGPLPPVPTFPSNNELSAGKPPVNDTPEGAIQNPRPVSPPTKPFIGTSTLEEEPLDIYIPDPDSIDPLSDLDPNPDADSDRNRDSNASAPQQSIGTPQEIEREGVEGRGEAEEEEEDEDEEGEAPLTPPDIVEVAAPLTKVHFNCYQDHRSMPLSRNAWHSTPCMACQKQDREIRFRCIFCCLRICSGCFEGLQKCPNRSLGKLVESFE